MSAPLLGCGGCASGSCATGICAGAGDPCPYGKPGLFTRLKNRISGKCDECLPTKPVKLGWTPPPCEPGDRQGLFGRLRARLGGGRDSGGACDTLCGSCGLSGFCGSGSPILGGCALPPIPGTPAPAAPATPPAAMPKEGASPDKPITTIPASPLASSSRF
jgi:hypothetical protein